MRARAIEIGVLGTSTLVVDGVPASLTGRRLRRLLAALVLGPGASVSSARLIEAVWEGSPSLGAASTLQGYVSRMRRLIEPPNAALGAHPVVRHLAGHYALVVGDGVTVDAHRFDRSVTAAQDFLGSLRDPVRPDVSHEPDRVEVQRERLDRALASWRGAPYADLGEDALAVAERRRLAERRVDGQTALLVMDLMAGRASQAASALEELVDAHPLREQLWQLWAVALVRSGRWADAAMVLDRLRALLASEVGIEPSAAVTTLRAEVLRQDPSLLGSPRQPERRSSRPQEGRPSALLGRDREVRLLTSALRETVAGRGRHAVVVGAPGMGKSRLLTEVLDWGRSHHRLTTVTFRGAGHAVAPPMWSLLRAVADLSEASETTAPDALREPAGGSVLTCAVAFADYLRSLARRTPVLLVVEDVHSVDRATTGALAYLVDKVVDLPVMLLVSRRPGVLDDESDDLAVEIARAGGLWLELPGLDTDGVRRLAGDLTTAHPLSETDAERLRARAGGNPLHIRALLEHEGDDVPPALVALVRAELRGLPAAAVDVLRAAAAWDPPFRADALASSLPYDDTRVEVELEAARRAGLVRHHAEGWTFSSPVVHEATLTVLARRAPTTRPP